MDEDQIPLEFTSFLSTATEPPKPDQFASPRLFRFPQYKEPITFKKLLGSGLEGEVFEVVIGGKTYALKSVRMPLVIGLPRI